MQQQVRHLQIARPLSELLDRVAAVAKDTVFPVYEGDGALARGCSGEAGIVEHDARQNLLPLAGRYPSLADRDLKLATRPVVDDCNALCHDARALLSGWMDPTALGASRLNAECSGTKEQPLLRLWSHLPGLFPHSVSPGLLSLLGLPGFYRCLFPARVLVPARELAGARMTFSIRGGDVAAERLGSPE